MGSADVLRYINLVWPFPEASSGRPVGSSTAELQVKRAAAAYLANCCDYRASSSAVACHIQQSIGSLKQLGIRKPFRQLLAADPSFVVLHPHVSEAYILLNVQQIARQGAAFKGQNQQQQPHTSSTQQGSQ